MKWTQEQIEKRMAEVERRNVYKHQWIYQYQAYWGELRWAYDLSKVSFDSYEAAERDRTAMAERHERLARLSMESGHDMVCI